MEGVSCSLVSLPQDKGDISVTGDANVLEHSPNIWAKIFVLIENKNRVLFNLQLHYDQRITVQVDTVCHKTQQRARVCG